VQDLRPRVRAFGGRAVRRARREWQWRTCVDPFAHGAAPADGFEHAVASHSSPLFRPLAGIDERLQRNKVVNLRLAAARLDGLVIRPGERLSFWRLVGPPTSRRGFLPGLVLSYGRIGEGVGGGLCQLTNLLYWMTIHTPLTVAERWRHNYDVFPDVQRTLPFGSGATCAWPALDLQIRNETVAAFRLTVEVTDTELVGEWRSDIDLGLRYSVYESAHVMTNDAPGVFVRHNQLRRRVYDRAGAQTGDEIVAENHALLMYQPFLEASPRTHCVR
jgi:vancomycin resistance protein VanW